MDHIIVSVRWNKAVKRLERRDKSEPDGLLMALLVDLGILFRRVM